MTFVRARRLIAIVAAAAALLIGFLPSPHATAGSGTPVFTNYAAPSSLPNSNNSGEPSVGVNWNSGAVMYQAYTDTFKVVFDDTKSPPAATWTDVTPPTSIFNIDPILFTDSTKGRTHAGGEAGGCSVLSYSDNDGSSWQQETNACSGTADHETVGGGPWHGSPPLGSTYDHAVYYCAQTSQDACSTSTNGGLTYGAPVLVNGACISLHGHVKVSADGTAYLPNNNCGNVGGGISSDNGSSWNSYTIAGQPQADRGFDPSVATTPDNTVYEAWARKGDYHPMVARSTSHGSSWDRVTDLAGSVNPPIVASTFQAATAGDNGRVAVAWLGTTTGSGIPFDNGYHGIWNLYVSYTYDGGLTWTTVQATSDPVQRGCIWDGGGSNVCRNLLDFNDAQVTKDGRVVVAYADGCINACAGPNGNESQSTSAWATISRQSAGKGLFSAYDGGGGNNPPTACFTHTESGLTTNVDASCSTDSDGTISSYAWAWGDGSANGSGKTASHTYSTGGTYTVSLTVTDNGGATGTTSQQVTVSGGGGDPDPGTPNLSNGVGTNDTSGASGSWKYYKIQVPTGKTQLKVDLSASQSCFLTCNPDLDLYVRRGAKPTTGTYDCKSAGGTSNESCTIANPAADWWYVGVYVYSGTKTLNYTIKATYS